MKTIEPTAEDRRLVRLDGYVTALTGVVFLAAILLVLLSAAIVIWQSGRWLNLGVWPRLTWLDGIEWLGGERPMLRGIGAQRILDWFLGLQLWSLPFFTAFVVTMGWITWADRESEDLRQARMRVVTWETQQRERSRQ